MQTCLLLDGMTHDDTATLLGIRKSLCPTPKLLNS